MSDATERITGAVDWKKRAQEAERDREMWRAQNVRLKAQVAERWQSGVLTRAVMVLRENGWGGLAAEVEALREAGE